ncbi:MAG: methyltransferase domain-containing protein [Patescibacteria group bacterium]
MKESAAKELLDLVRDGYNEIAVDFDATRRKELWPEMRRFAVAVKDGEKILDAGCGNGRLLEALKDKKIEYLGIDNSKNLLALARRNYPAQNFLEADILDLRALPDGYFDQIFCLAVLSHLPTRARRVEALRQLALKLKPGGEIIISVWNLKNNPRYRPLIFKNILFKILGKHKFGWRDLVFTWKDSRGKEIGQRYYYVFSPRELKKTVIGADLKIKEFFKNKFNYWLVLRREE